MLRPIIEPSEEPLLAQDGVGGVVWVHRRPSNPYHLATVARSGVAAQVQFTGEDLDDLLHRRSAIPT
jgi:hypothetical protein